MKLPPFVYKKYKYIDVYLTVPSKFCEIYTMSIKFPNLCCKGLVSSSGMIWICLNKLSPLIFLYILKSPPQCLDFFTLPPSGMVCNLNFVFTEWILFNYLSTYPCVIRPRPLLQLINALMSKHSKLKLVNTFIP